MRDPDDDYLELMRVSGADMLVSLDRDLLGAEIQDVATLDRAAFVARLADKS